MDETLRAHREADALDGTFATYSGGGVPALGAPQ